jgi:hypothetical protein
MTAKELTEKLAEIAAEFPNRELHVHARNESIGVEVETGRVTFPVQNDEPSLGRGYGSRWILIEVPDALDT